MDGNFRGPMDAAVAERCAGDLGAGQGLDDLQGSRLIIEEIVVRAEKKTDAILVVQPHHFLGDAGATLDAVLPLVVGGDRPIGAGKLAAEGHDQRADGAQLTDLAIRQGLRAERGPAAWGVPADESPGRGEAVHRDRRRDVVPPNQ